MVEVSSEQLLSMKDEELTHLLSCLGIRMVVGWGRDKMIETIVKIAYSATDV